MPILKSAKKALRVTERRTQINIRVKGEFKQARKVVLDAIDAGKLDAAQKALPLAYSKIDMAAKKGVIHKNTAARYKSRLANQLKKASSK